MCYFDNLRRYRDTAAQEDDPLILFDKDIPAAVIESYTGHRSRVRKARTYEGTAMYRGPYVCRLSLMDPAVILAYGIVPKYFVKDLFGLLPGELRPPWRWIIIAPKVLSITPLKYESTHP